MANETLTIGTEIIAKVGRNEVEAVITAINGDEVMAKSHKSGKTFRVKTILKICSIPQDDPVPSVEPETVVTEAPVTAPKEKKLSLFSAAVRILEAAPGDAICSAGELVREAVAQGLWTPGQGKTPDLTLYAAILRDIATKEYPRIVRADQRGKFKLGARVSSFILANPLAKQKI